MSPGTLSPYPGGPLSGDRAFGSDWHQGVWTSFPPQGHGLSAEAQSQLMRPVEHGACVSVSGGWGRAGPLLLVEGTRKQTGWQPWGKAPPAPRVHAVAWEPPPSTSPSPKPEQASCPFPKSQGNAA